MKTLIVDFLMPAEEKIPSCTCVWKDGKDTGRVRKTKEGTFRWDIDPECEYHQLAARYPHDHRIPWNCPTYYDGCHCD